MLSAPQGAHHRTLQRIHGQGSTSGLSAAYRKTKMQTTENSKKHFVPHILCGSAAPDRACATDDGMSKGTLRRQCKAAQRWGGKRHSISTASLNAARRAGRGTGIHLVTIRAVPAFDYSVCGFQRPSTLQLTGCVAVKTAGSGSNTA